MTTITMELVCLVQSNPTTSPTWVFTSNQDRVARNITRLVERLEGKDMVSVVIITSPKDLHLGEYVCGAANSLGEDSREIVIKGEVGC